MYDNITPIFGTGGADTLVGTNAAEVFSGRAANDNIATRAGNDEAYGGSGDDVIAGESGDDILYGGGGPSYVDLSSLKIDEDYQGAVTFMGETAGFRNALGLYKVAEDGAITDVQILFPNASQVGSGGDLIPGQSSVPVELQAGDQIGFFIVSNGSGISMENTRALMSEGEFVFRAADTGDAGNLYDHNALVLMGIDPVSREELMIRSEFGVDIFHSAAFPANDYAPNPDNYAHTVGRVNAVTGEITLGFEDLKWGGDHDYDDTVFVFDVGTSNARVLDPNIPFTENSTETELSDAAIGTPIVTVSENDQLFGGKGDDKVFGMAGNDRVEGNDGRDQLWGNSGNDALYGGSGDDKLSGGKNDDALYGQSGDDVLNGNSGDDLLDGGTGRDTLFGNSGNDILLGGSNFDLLDGGSGDDILDGGSGNDTLIGGTGNDRLLGGTGTDELDGGKGADWLDGGNGSDRLKGGSGDDTLIGANGKDYLNGGAGDDFLQGGNGVDTLLGERGNDLLSGGDGHDLFVLRASDFDGNLDTILDFEHGDRIELRGFELASFDQVAEAAFDYQEGLYISLGENDGLLIHQMTVAALEQDMFLFT